MEITPDNVMYLKDGFAKTKNNKSTLVYGKVIADADFSIVIPIYGLNPFFSELLENLQSLSPSSLKVQIIISDNKVYSTPGGGVVVNTLKGYDFSNLAYYQSNEPLGQFNNFNRCMELCNTDYVGMIHDDDLLIKNYLNIVEKILPYLRRKKNIGMVHGRYLVFNTKEDLSKMPHGKKDKVEMFRIRKAFITHTGFTNTGIPSCGTIFNKRAFVSCGGFNEEYPSSGDAFLAGTMLYSGYEVFEFRSLTGYYRIAINTSLRLNICQGFINEDELFRQSWRSTGSFFRKIYMKLFQNLLYSQNIDGKVKAFSRYNAEITVENLDYKKSYKKYSKYSPIVFVYRCFSFMQRVVNKLITKKIK